MSLGCLAAHRKLHILTAMLQPGTNAYTHTHTDPVISLDGSCRALYLHGYALLTSGRLLKPALSKEETEGDEGEGKDGREGGS